MKLNKYRLGSTLRYNFTSPEEYQQRSMYMRGMHDLTQQALLDQEGALQFEYADVDDPYVSPKVEALQNKISNTEQQLLTQGYNPTLQNNLVQLRKEYMREAGPKGTIGRAQSNYKAMQQALSDYDKAHAKDPEWFREANKKNIIANYKGMQDEAGNFVEFTPGRATGYRDVGEDFLSYAKNYSGVSEDDLGKFMTGQIGMHPVQGPNGQTYLQVVEKTPGTRITNKPQLEALLNEFYAQYTDPNTDRGLFAQLAQKSPEEIQRTLGNMAQVAGVSKYGMNPGWNASVQRVPEQENDTANPWNLNFLNPNEKSIVTRNVPAKNADLFESVKDASNAIRSNTPSYDKSAGENLVRAAFTYDMIPSDLGGVPRKEDFDPVEFYQQIPEQKKELKELYNQAVNSSNREGIVLYADQIKQLDKLEDNVKSTMKTKMDASKGDLAVPMFSFTPDMKNYSTIVNNTNTHLNHLPLEGFEFTGGDLKGLSDKKLKKDEKYEALRKKREVVSIGVERDAGMFFIIKGDDNVEHMVKLKDKFTDNEAKFAQLVGRPDLYEAAIHKDYKFKDNKIFFAGEERGNLNFKVNNITDESGTRLYQLNGVTLGDYYDAFKSNLTAQSKEQYGENIPQEVIAQMDAFIAQQMYDKFKLKFDDSEQIDWNYPLETTNKATVLEVNQIIKK